MRNTTSYQRKRRTDVQIAVHEERQLCIADLNANMHEGEQSSIAYTATGSLGEREMSFNTRREREREK